MSLPGNRTLLLTLCLALAFNLTTVPNGKIDPYLNYQHSYVSDVFSRRALHSLRPPYMTGTLHAAEDWASKKMHLDLWQSGKSPGQTSGSGSGSAATASHGKIAAKAGSGSGSGSKFMPLDGGDYEFDRWGEKLRAFSSSNTAKTGGGSGGSSSSTDAGSSRSSGSGSGSSTGGGFALDFPSSASL